MKCAIIGLLLMLSGGAAAEAVESVCDPRLAASAKDEWAYQQRDDRCEGRYAPQRGETLLLLGFTEVMDVADFSAAVNIEWSAPKPQQVHVQAQALALRGFAYRMDALRPNNDQAYLWPTDVAQAVALSPKEAYLIGWAAYSIGGATRDVYLPLRVTQQPPAGRADAYRVVLWTWDELEEVFVSVATVKADGAPNEFMQDGQPLGYGYYPAGRAIELTLPKPPRPGIYYLEIGATLRKGGVVTLERWFYSPAE